MGFFVVLAARHFFRTVSCPIKGGIDWGLPAPEISRIFFSRRPPFFSYFVPEDELLLTSSEDELVLCGGRARPRYFCAATVLAVRPCWPRGPFCQQLIICSKNLAACLARLLVKNLLAQITLAICMHLFVSSMCSGKILSSLSE